MLYSLVHQAGVAWIGKSATNGATFRGYPGELRPFETTHTCCHALTMELEFPWSPGRRSTSPC